MERVVLLNSNENTKRVEEEEKGYFVRDLLSRWWEGQEEDVFNLFNEDGSLTIENKIKLRALLLDKRMQIIDDDDGGLLVTCENKKIAEWKKPNYILKQDLKQRDKKKQLYLEMHINSWTVVDKNEEEKEEE
jgi:hypothetical protein